MTYPGDNWNRGHLGGPSMRARLQSLTNAVTTLISSPSSGATQSYVDTADTALSGRITTLEGAPSADPLTLLKQHFVLVEDFPNGLVGSAIAEVKSGTGAGSSPQSAFAASQNGIMQLGTGSTATGSCYVATSPNAIIVLGYGAAKFTGKAQLGTLSNGTDGYVARIGLLDVFTGATVVDGVWFEYDSTVSANWQVCTSSNSTATKTTTSTAVDTSYHSFDITVNAAGNSAAFSIDGTVVGTNTTNIPTQGSRATGMGAGITKNLGTTQVLYKVDYLGVDVAR